MASSLVLTIKSARTSTDVISRIVKSTTSPKEQARALAHFFHRLESGLDAASLDVQTSAAAPVAASGTITLTYASMANLDTLTVAGVTLTCVTGTPSGAQFKKVTDGPTTAANLVALINANTSTSKYVIASAVASVVTVTCLVKGEIGNLVGLATSNGTGAAVSAATLASGAGGAVSSIATSYSLGL